MKPSLHGCLHALIGKSHGFQFNVTLITSQPNMKRKWIVRDSFVAQVNITTAATGIYRNVFGERHVLITSKSTFHTVSYRFVGLRIWTVGL
jgi:hypothetical protein